MHYLIAFFRNSLLENFRKLQFGLGFPEFLNPKKIPQICRENFAILEKLRDSANSKPTIHFSKKAKPCSKIILQFRYVHSNHFQRNLFIVSSGPAASLRPRLTRMLKCSKNVSLNSPMANKTPLMFVPYRNL